MVALVRVLRPVFAVVAGGRTGPPGPHYRRLWIGRVYLPAVAEVILAVALFFGTNGNLLAENARRGHPYGAALLIFLSFAGAAPLLLRDRFPLAAWRLSAAAMAASAILVPPRTLLDMPYLPSLLAVYLLCLYAVAVRCERAVTIGAMAITVVGVFVIDPRTSGFALLAAVPVLFGYLVRLRRTAKEALAEQEERHAAETAVLQERQRIARELHDVVAHHMSVIAIQAEAAPYKVTEPPPELAESFADIRASALEGLTELRRILGVLRTEESAEIVPQPGLERLDEVVSSARNGGLTVETEVSGEPSSLPEGVGLSAFRILQEALSNAMKHAPGATVRVQITYDPARLRLRVVNGPGARPPAHGGTGGGHGLVGMRERTTMLGGELGAGPTSDGGFAVVAVLPLEAV